MTEFFDRDDWFRDIYDVRKRRLLDPCVDLDGDGDVDEEQNEEAGNRVIDGAAGMFIGGTYRTRSWIELRK